MYCATSAQLHKITPAAYHSPLCNTCGKIPETQDYIFTYGHREARKQQIKALKTIEREAKEGRKNTLIQTLIKDLHALMHNLPPPQISEKKHPVHILVRDAYAAQDLLGWNNAIRGRLLKKWQEAQN